jgi:peptide deformylase
MHALPIRCYPDPLLKQPTRPVDRLTDKTTRLIDDLIRTMRQHPRCVGLAAPQVGSDLSIAVMDATGHPKVPQAQGLLVLVNPRIVRVEGAVRQREGCLSVPDLTGSVVRAAVVELEAFDRAGARLHRRLEGFEAVIAQHEIDHLEGRLFLDRVVNPGTDIFHRKHYA